MFLVTCGEDDISGDQEDRSASDKVAIEQYLMDSSIVAIEDPSGIYYSIPLANPTGDTQELFGRVLSIYYTARILGDSLSFDANTLEGGDMPLKLKQGVNSVFPAGLDIGLAYMKKGEKFIFYIPSALAYQDYSFSTLIPAYSILEIEVELIDIENELDILTEEISLIENYIAQAQLDSTIIDSTLVMGVYIKDTTLYHPLDSVELLPSGVYYKRQSEGLVSDTLQLGDIAAFSYDSYNLDSVALDQRPSGEPFVFSFLEQRIMEGIESGLQVMERNESALLIIPSMYGYKESVFVIPSFQKQEFVDLEIIPQYAAKINPFEVLIFEIHLMPN
jgi:FKBP-type peptidyl-prolyl cis-trans isomerase